ncbi:MAG: Gfo/Idh/MocA family oxidoreductase [Candidimonas sp.]|nr:Gfo/Idh/MocA family oxidoreductase [Candidimonas sp.]
MKLALIGMGKIAHDQHLPALATSPDWTLAATVDREVQSGGQAAFTGIEDLLRARPDIETVSLCLPPVPRFLVAQAALAAGRHVMLEKPPGATLSEVRILSALARTQGLTLYTTWHSRAAAAVASAKAWLCGKKVRSGKITWREDVRKWHPRQDWILDAGGMGVFDTGINALSILTEILPEPVHLTSAELEFPDNREAPIAARLTLTHGIEADFDFRQEGWETWDMTLCTDEGHLTLRLGGNLLEIDGEAAGGEPSVKGEYPVLYARMAELVRQRQSEVDLSPFELVADAFMLGRRTTVAPFEFNV